MSCLSYLLLRPCYQNINYIPYQYIHYSYCVQGCIMWECMLGLHCLVCNWTFWPMLKHSLVQKLNTTNQQGWNIRTIFVLIKVLSISPSSNAYIVHLPLICIRFKIKQCFKQRILIFNMFINISLKPLKLFDYFVSFYTILLIWKRE